MEQNESDQARHQRGRDEPPYAVVGELIAPQVEVGEARRVGGQNGVEPDVREPDAAKPQILHRFQAAALGQRRDARVAEGASDVVGGRKADHDQVWHRLSEQAETTPALTSSVWLHGLLSRSTAIGLSPVVATLSANASTTALLSSSSRTEAPTTAPEQGSTISSTLNVNVSSPTVTSIGEPSPTH